MFTTVVKVISSLSAATIVVNCLQQTQAAESSSQPWSECARSYRLYVYGYVVMPEHIHLLLSEPQRDTLADVLRSLKE